jgi:hypothetical protein
LEAILLAPEKKIWNGQFEFTPVASIRQKESIIIVHEIYLME